jgi:hypothetical protein
MVIKYKVTMGEFIRTTPENETTPERMFWDRFIRALDKIHTITLYNPSYEVEDFDFIETLEAMRHETEEDAITLLFNYAIMVETPSNTSTSDDLEEVWELLGEYGFEQEE